MRVRGKSRRSIFRQRRMTEIQWWAPVACKLSLMYTTVQCTVIVVSVQLYSDPVPGGV